MLSKFLFHKHKQYRCSINKLIFDGWNVLIFFKEQLIVYMLALLSLKLIYIFINLPFQNQTVDNTEKWYAASGRQ